MARPGTRAIVGARRWQRHERRAVRFLLDAEHKRSTLCEQDTNGVWRVTRNVDLPVSDFSGLRTVALGGTTSGASDFSAEHHGMDAAGGDDWDFATLDGYDSPIKDGYLNDVIAGDLTGPRAEGPGVSGDGEK